MADMMELDSILEDDLMSALENFETTVIDSSSKKTSVVEAEPKEEIISTQAEQTNIETKPSLNMEANSDNLNSIGKFLQELLNNKTLEITIKLKDN